MNLNTKIYPDFFKNGYKVKKEKLGRGNIYSYSMNEFYFSAIESLTEDLYACLEGRPLIRPYTK